MRAAFVVALTLAVAGVGCRGSSTPAGGALDVGDPSGTRLRRIPVGNEHIHMIAGFRNRSDSTVTVLDVTLDEASELHPVVELVRIELAVPTPDGPSLGTYETYPPVVAAPNGCRAQATAAPADFEVEAGQRVLILIWLRAVEAGAYSIPAEEVTYEHDGRIHQQSVPFEIRGTVRERAGELEAFPRARRCADTAQLLPGWRVPRR